jgi:ribosome recycling factor
VRRDGNEELKKALKDKTITEDMEKKGLDDIQKQTDKYIKLVDEQLAVKEKEILEI